MSVEKLEIRTRVESDRLVSWSYRQTESDTLVVSFSGIGKSTHTIPSYEFPKTATLGGTVNGLFISDPQRTWLNGSGLIENIVDEIETYRKETNARRLVFVGHSMGGFSALAMPHFIRVDSVLALAPQFSIHPDYVPDETRWLKWRERIADYRIPSVSDLLCKATKYTVIYGRHEREAPQRDRFPSRKNIRMYIMPRTRHNVPQRLKSIGVHGRVFEYVVNGRPRKLRILLQNKTSAVLRNEPSTV